MPAQQLHEDEYNTISFDRSNGILRFTRTAKHYPNTASILASIAALDTVSSRVGARRVLVDSRAAPLRTDPEFEEVSRKHFHPLMARFERVAVLVATATGKLQLRRIQREDGTAMELFDNEAAALTFLLRSAG